MAMTPKEHIEVIRRKKYSIGGEPNPLTEDLHQSVKNLASELYTKDVHFLMEIIQNAEDNVYEDGVKPSLEFIVTNRDITGTGAASTLLVFNNEKGFSPKNVESICGVGRSTKKGQRQSGYIGEKGIGFKSVFLITAQPYIFSNGYQIRFSEEPCPHCSLGYIVPEWVEENPSLADIKEVYGLSNALPTTTIILPLKPDKEIAVKQQLSSIHPEVLLFLAKIRRISVRENNKDPSLNTVSAISISSETDWVSRKNVAAESYTLHLAADEDSKESERNCCYYMWKQKFPVNQANKVERRMEFDEMVITLAFPKGQRLDRGTHSPGIYAFLPTEMVTNLPFIIQADFVLASSRETILLDNTWNQGILDCVPSAFVHAFISMVKTVQGAPASSLASQFEFVPVDSSSYQKLNTVREAIRDKLVQENIIPSESYSTQMFFYKPSEVGRIMPAFWDILIRARKQGVSMHNLSSHGRYALNSAFDQEDYDDVLNFLGVRSMDNEWYSKCIQSSNIVLGVSEDVYLELLLFVTDNWRSHFHYTNMKNIPLLKYVGQDGNDSLCSIYEVTQRLGKKIYASYNSSHISWLIDCNHEFGCPAGHFFLPKTTQEGIRSSHQKLKLLDWLREHAETSIITVDDYATHLLDSLSNERRHVIAFARFLFHSFSRSYVSKTEVISLCKKMPLVDNYGCVSKYRSGVLVPASGSRWVELIGSNPWRRKNYVELGEDYMRAGSFAGVHTSGKQLIDFLVEHVGASDIPNLCPPDDAFPTVSSPLTKENALLLLSWIRNLDRQGRLVDGMFLRCIKEGGWLRTCLGSSVSYRSPSQSFLLTPACGSLLQNGSEMVDIPLIDQQFYDNNIIFYKDELKTLGVMTEFGEACQFIGKRLMLLAANTNLTRTNVFSILNFIKFLIKNTLPPTQFINSVKEGRWLRTSCGQQSPAGSILRDSEWQAVSVISNLPFVDEAYYGVDIHGFRTELQLLGVIVGFDKNYQRVADYFRMPTSFTSMTADVVLLVLKCIRSARSPDEFAAKLRSQKWLKTTHGYRAPSECFLVDSEWGSLLMIFECFPLITGTIYGKNILSYKDELKKLGVVVNFEDAAKAFARRFKEYAASSGSITKEKAFLLLKCYRQLKQAGHQFPTELSNCIREEKWLATRLGLRSPKESILFNPLWENLNPLGLLPFIQDGDNYYGDAIHKYKHELHEMGVTVEFNKGSKFVAAGFWIPHDLSEITRSSVLTLLYFIRNMLQEQNASLLKELSEKAGKRWLKTYRGYRSPSECLLFDSEGSSVLQCEDGPFIDEKFYGPGIRSYKKELNAIGVVVDVLSGSKLLAGELESHSDFVVISRVYSHLQKVGWEPDNKDASWIWIPQGTNKGRWVSAEECVIRDRDNLFGLQLNVLEKYYEKELLSFFSMALGVRSNPSVDDYCILWKTWEESGQRLTRAECCAFWACIAKHWTPKTKKLLSDVVKLPVNSGSNAIQLVDKQDAFIPDDLLLKDLFDKASPNPIFVWYPQPSLPSMPRTKLHEIYSSIGVRSISESVQRGEIYVPNGELNKQINPRDELIQRGLVKLLLGYLADPTLEMDADKRQKTIKALINLNVFEVEEPITVKCSLSLSKMTLDVKTSRMIRWERENSKLFTQKMDRSSGHKTNLEFATYFSEVIAEGLLWEKADRVGDLSELIKFGWLLEFEEEAISFLLKTKNLQLFMEDEEFLNSAFTSK